MAMRLSLCMEKSWLHGNAELNPKAAFPAAVNF
jgi:hypothetical protein